MIFIVRGLCPGPAPRFRVDRRRIHLGLTRGRGHGLYLILLLPDEGVLRREEIARRDGGGAVPATAAIVPPATTVITAVVQVVRGDPGREGDEKKDFYDSSKMTKMITLLL